MLKLAKALSVGGVDYEINSDWRPCFGIMQAFEREDITTAEKLMIMVGILYVEDIQPENYDEAIDKALWFLDPSEDKRPSQYGRLYSWERDEKFIISAADQTIGGCRRKKYLHWWEFTAALMECKECVFSTLVHQRKLKKLNKQNKWDKEWWAENKDIAELKTTVTLSDEEQAKYDEFNKLLGE
jgi:hypothetical protein